MKPTGLRMYLHPSRKRTRISLEGDLSGDWVRELERCWRALSGPGDSLYVNVCRVESTDRDGHRLLATMHRQGCSRCDDKSHDDDSTHHVTRIVYSGAPRRCMLASVRAISGWFGSSRSDCRNAAAAPAASPTARRDSPNPFNAIVDGGAASSARSK